MKIKQFVEGRLIINMMRILKTISLLVGFTTGCTSNGLGLENGKARVELSVEGPNVFIRVNNQAGSGNRPTTVHSHYIIFHFFSVYWSTRHRRFHLRGRGGLGPPC